MVGCLWNSTTDWKSRFDGQYLSVVILELTDGGLAASEFQMGRIPMTVSVSTEGKAIEQMATASAGSGSAFEALLTHFEPTVNGWMSEGLSKNACRNRLVANVDEHAKTMNKRNKVYADVAEWLASDAPNDLLRLVNMAERRTVVAPIFEQAEQDVNACDGEFLKRWAKLDATATEHGADIVDVVANLTPSKRGKFTRATHEQAVALIKPVEIPQDDQDIEDIEDDEDVEASEVTEEVAATVLDIWHTFEEKMNNVQDITSEDLEYLVLGFEQMIEDCKRRI